MDPWARQRTLARTTVGWAVGSVAVGAALAARRDPWWRSFGQQHAGWGAVDLAIVGVVTVLQHRRMAALADPYAPAALEHERRQLRTILAANAVADAGYCVVGALMWRRGHQPRVTGAGAAIVVQGAFLMVHDAWHAARSSA